MDYEARPPRRGLSPNLPSNLIGQIARLDYAVFTKADPSLAWRIFSDLSQWPKFFPLYTNIRWQGPAWTQGSRLRVEIQAPVNAVMDRVLTFCMPPNNIAWINHVRGYTMEQWVSFDPYAGGGSRVSTWIEITGGDLSPEKGEENLQLLRQMIVTSFDNFARECDHAADTAGTGDILPAAD